ncbi:MAG: FAD-binding oxidoreductase [Alphaproteobacteria bacterium]|nr:MAG: FAD-binding oxidoreductase [Alphaproteobacteria bacterium]
MRELTQIFGAENVIGSGVLFDSALQDWRRRYRGKAEALIYPSSTAQVVQLVLFCRQHGFKIVPQGGNTSMCGAATPDQNDRNILVNFKKMNKILECSASGFSMTVESGCSLAQVQDFAAKQDRLFPLMLTPRENVQIGGAVATNAGGLNVIKYGMMRNLTLGIEAVMADGSIWNNLYQLTKNNAGYDLKQLLIGSEGTLGIITKVALKLFPLPKQRLVAILAVDSFKNCLAALSSAQNEFGQQLSAFEYISAPTWNLTHEYDASLIKPVRAAEHYILIQLESLLPSPGIESEFILAAKKWAGVLDCNATIDRHKAAQLWQIRKSIPLAERQAGPSIKHDISIPPNCWEEFLRAVPDKIRRQYPTSQIITMGHLGDGNLHFNVTLPGLTADTLATIEPVINDIVYAEITRLRGSISAEHGIGQLKGSYLKRLSDPNHYELLQKIKHALDPDNILNPGKIFIC